MADRKVKPISDDPAGEARLDALADAEIDAGQFVTNERVGNWLKSWGTPGELPCPKPDKI